MEGLNNHIQQIGFCRKVVFIVLSSPNKSLIGDGVAARRLAVFARSPLQPQDLLVALSASRLALPSIALRPSADCLLSSACALRINRLACAATLRSWEEGFAGASAAARIVRILSMVAWGSFGTSLTLMDTSPPTAY